MKSRLIKKYCKAMSIFDVYCGDKSARAMIRSYYWWRRYLKKRDYKTYKKLQRYGTEARNV